MWKVFPEPIFVPRSMEKPRMKALEVLIALHVIPHPWGRENMKVIRRVNLERWLNHEELSQLFPIGNTFNPSSITLSF
jgi:hypothetical protein